MTVSIEDEALSSPDITESSKPIKTRSLNVSQLSALLTVKRDRDRHAQPLMAPSCAEVHKDILPYCVRLNLRGKTFADAMSRCLPGVVALRLTSLNGEGHAVLVVATVATLPYIRGRFGYPYILFCQLR